MKKTATLHLSVRQAREYEQAKKDKEIAEARIAAFEQLGSTDLNKLATKAEKAISKFMVTTFTKMKIPATLMRKVAANAVHTAIPKSPRGRKPMEKKEEAA